MVLHYGLEIYENHLSNQWEINTCMRKSRNKVSEYGLNQINKRVLLSVPKLITVGEGIPSPYDVTGVFP